MHEIVTTAVSDYCSRVMGKANKRLDMLNLLKSIDRSAPSHGL